MADKATQVPPRSVPSFVHVLPCTNPPVKYLDRLDGCATGIHVAPEDAQDLQVLYGKMAEAIKAKDDQPQGEASPGPCSLCRAPIVPSTISPLLYMENCAHYFHYDCLRKCHYEEATMRIRNDCPQCREVSTRTLLWPRLLPTSEAKNEMFQLQKRTFGLNVAQQTILEVHVSDTVNELPDFGLVVWTGQKMKHITVRKRQSPEEEPRKNRSPFVGELSMKVWRFGFGVNEIVLVREIQRFHLADQAIYLGDILPLEDKARFEAERAAKKPPLLDWMRREKLLLQFRCPFARLDAPGPKGERCTEGVTCEFFHAWPQNTPSFIVERVKVRDFPKFFCLHNSRIYSRASECTEHIRLHSQELVRCSAGFHPSTQDLQNMDEFACKMAKQIMVPVVVPEAEHHIVCAFCRKSGEPVMLHLKNCVHCLHVHCLPLVRLNISNPNRQLELHCPACQVPSVRTIAWPGPFPSDMVKQTIIVRQLEQFELKVPTDTQVAIVQVPIVLANRVIFTLDYGGPTVVNIDATAAQDRSTIWYE